MIVSVIFLIRLLGKSLLDIDIGVTMKADGNDRYLSAHIESSDSVQNTEIRFLLREFVLLRIQN